MRSRLLLPAAALAVAALAGCSQAAQLQPVAGGQISAVRTATNDVLVDQKVDIHVAPVCSYSDPLFTCRGTTADGQDIVSEATVVSAFGATKTEYGAYTPADVTLKVTVGSDEIFNGQVENVLLSNGQEQQ